MSVKKRELSGLEENFCLTVFSANSAGKAGMLVDSSMNMDNGSCLLSMGSAPSTFHLLIPTAMPSQKYQ